MKFGMINAIDRRVYIDDFKSLKHAQDALGLTDIDHGMIAGTSNIAYVISACALLTSPEEQYYFSIGRTLMGGNVVLYAINVRSRNTVDFEKRFMPAVLFYKDHHEVERSIQAGAINRPRVGVATEEIDITTWEWGMAPVVERG